jgi:DNA-binding XRE family transcriptional regulator
MLLKELLKQLRERLLLTQAEMASKLKISRASVCHIEQGGKKVNFKIVRKIVDEAKKNGIEVEYKDIEVDHK